MTFVASISIVATGQSIPETKPNDSGDELRRTKIDVSRLDTISNTQNEIKNELRNLMRMRDPE